MKKEILVGTLLTLLVIYIVFVGIPVIRFETEKVIETKSDENKFHKEVEILLPAVEESGDGIIASLKVEVNEGKGRTLLEINDISFWEDTQQSVRTAKSVAEKITGVDATKYDIIYSINANASKIEGPSAGAAMAIATTIALENKTINNSVVITGYLREDGTIGKVAGILPKAKTAKENNMQLFLVPLGQRTQTKIETKKNCEDYAYTTFCQTEAVEKNVDIQEEVGINVVEVGSISEALKYFVVD